jgi:hypothetical protein
MFNEQMAVASAGVVHRFSRGNDGKMYMLSRYVQLLLGGALHAASQHIGALQ